MSSEFEEARNRDVVLATVRSVVGLVRAKWSSRNKDLDGLLLTATEVMQTTAPHERFPELSRVMLDVSLQKKREPVRAVAAEAALLDLVLESLHSWVQREPQLAAATNSTIAVSEAQRAALGEGRHRFEEEVAAIRSTLYP